jgi:hypothetical protein
MNGNRTLKRRPTRIRAGSKARAVYDRAHLAWRAGAISSWYYGRRSPEDSTVVWLLDGREYQPKDLAGVSAAVEAAMSRVGVSDAAFGDVWCGYRSVVLTYLDGTVVVERFDSTAGVVVRERVAAEVAA